MFLLLGTPKSIEDVSGKVVNTTPIRELRNKFKMLVIDDRPFAQKENLTKHGFDLHKESDLNDMNLVDAYQIVLCDIQGVGGSLGGRSGGFLIKEIKKNYPQKYVLAYSGHSFDTTFNDYFQKADGTIAKDADLEDWLDRLDDVITKIVDPVIQWKRAREILINQGMRLQLVMYLENSFVQNLESSEKLKEWSESNRISHLKPEAKSVLKDLVKGLLLAKLGI